MNYLFDIKGKVTGVDSAARRMRYAPENYRRGLFGWMISERNSFIGNETKDGAFRKKLARKKNAKGTPWAKSVYRNFKGYVSGEQKIDTMKLKMGISPKSKKKFIEGLRILGSGGNINSSKFMPVPVWKNLKSIGVEDKSHKAFKELVSARGTSGRHLTYIRSGGKVYYFDSQNQNSEKGILFIGVKKIKVKQQFDFQGDWERRLPKVLERGQKKIDNSTNKINKDYQVTL